jgi:hypothetical protein
VGYGGDAWAELVCVGEFLEVFGGILASAMVGNCLLSLPISDFRQTESVPLGFPLSLALFFH